MDIFDAPAENPEYEEIAKGFAKLEKCDDGQEKMKILAELREVAFRWNNRRSELDLPPCVDALDIADWLQAQEREMVREALFDDAPLPPLFCVDDIFSNDDVKKNVEGLWAVMKSIFDGGDPPETCLLSLNGAPHNDGELDFKLDVMADFVRLLETEIGRKMLRKAIFGSSKPHEADKRHPITIQRRSQTPGKPHEGPVAVSDPGDIHGEGAGELQGRTSPKLETGHSEISGDSASPDAETGIHPVSDRELRGPGADSLINYYDDHKDSDIPLATETGNHLFSPRFVVLAHELLHALHDRRGSGRKHVADPSPDAAEYDDPEERWTIDDAKSSENAVRAAYGLNAKRYGHGAADPSKEVADSMRQKIENMPPTS